MQTLKIKVIETDVAVIEQSGKITAGNVNQIQCVFDFSQSFDNLIIRASFNGEFVTVEQGICFAPELTEGTCQLGVYGYSLEENELKLRISPSPCSFFVYPGSYSNLDVNANQPSCTELEEYYWRIKEITDKLMPLRDSIELGETTQTAIRLPIGMFEAEQDGYVIIGYGDYQEVVFCKKGSILFARQLTPYYSSTYIINQEDIIIDNSVEDLPKIIRLSELYEIRGSLEAVITVFENILYANPKKGEVISATGELNAFGQPVLNFNSLPAQKELIKSITLTEECVEILIDKDENGNAFDLNYAEIVFDVPSGNRVNCEVFLNNFDELTAKSISLQYLIQSYAQKRFLKIQSFPNMSLLEYFSSTVRCDNFEESNISALKFILSSAVNFPVGTKIDLYGVRNYE